MDLPQRIAVFGTDEPIPPAAPYAAGPMTLELESGAVRRLGWHGIELVRAIDCPVRDEGWGTYPQENPSEACELRDGGFRIERRFAVGAGGLQGRLTLEGRAEGRFGAELELTARRDFSTNRAGFVLLHPPRLAGRTIRVVRPNGAEDSVAIPRRISPGQPVFDIAGLGYDLEGAGIQITFRGERFEMEDQRNWTDASFKTYCRSLFQPYPYRIVAGQSVRQSIEIRLRGGGAASPASRHGSSRISLQPGETAEPVPVPALILDEECLPAEAEAGAARRAGARALRLRVRPDTCAEVLRAAQGLVGPDAVDVDLEIVVPRDAPVDECLAGIAGRVRGARLAIGHVIALPEPYLHNYQPTDPAPDGPTPRDAAVAARRAFPGLKVGGGMLTHFTEFNRCRPDLSVCDYVTHGASAILHAADDRTVVENLEGLADVFASGRELADGRAYRPGLVSIGLRTNPHGSEVAENRRQVRRAAAGVDPRHRGLFGAAWMVGAMAATEGHGVASLALAGAVGAFGVVYRRAEWPQPGYDGRADARVYPVFHALRFLARMGGARRLRLSGAPDGVAGVAAARAEGTSVLVANLSRQDVNLAFPHAVRLRRLDRSSFQAATANPDWLGQSATESCSAVQLEPFATAFAEFSS